MLEVLLGWYGSDHPVSEFKKREAAKFKTDVLLKLPANRMTAPQTRSLSPQNSLQVSSVPKISNATVNRYLGCYRLFWTFMDAHGMVGVPHLIWSAVMIKVRRTENGEQAIQTRRSSSEVTAG